MTLLIKKHKHVRIDKLHRNHLSSILQPTSWEHGKLLRTARQLIALPCNNICSGKQQVSRKLGGNSAMLGQFIAHIGIQLPDIPSGLSLP